MSNALTALHSTCNQLTEAAIDDQLAEPFVPSGVIQTRPPAEFVAVDVVGQSVLWSAFHVAASILHEGWPWPEEKITSKRRLFTCVTPVTWALSLRARIRLFSG